MWISLMLKQVIRGHTVQLLCFKGSITGFLNEKHIRSLLAVTQQNEERIEKLLPLNYWAKCETHWDISSTEFLSNSRNLKANNKMSGNSITSWSRVRLEKLIVAHLFNKSFAYFGTKRFIVSLTFPNTRSHPEPKTEIITNCTSRLRMAHRGRNM
jgi:hypothetical protein